MDIPAPLRKLVLHNKGNGSALFRKGLASSMLASYTSAENRYSEFCSSQSIDSFPLFENHLCYFVSVLANEVLSIRISIMLYAEIVRGLPNRFAGASFSHLEYG